LGIGWLIGWLISQRIEQFFEGLTAWLLLEVLPGPSGTPILSLMFGLSGLIAGLVIGLIWAFRSARRPLSRAIQPVETLRWFWRSSFSAGLKGLVLGLVFGPIVGVIDGLLDQLYLEIALDLAPRLELPGGEPVFAWLGTGLEDTGKPDPKDPQPRAVSAE
jgi:hypothetical protein